MAGGEEAFTNSFTAADVATFVCRLSSADALPLAAPAAEFAALSHMLGNGFFFNRGLFDFETLDMSLADGDTLFDEVQPELADAPADIS